MKENLTDDEWRLLHFFRCISSAKQSDILFDVGSKAIEECIPDKNIYELMPFAAGIKPEGIEYLQDPHSIAYIIYCGIEETGEPYQTLLGSSYCDEEEAIPRFAKGAEKAALEQGSFFNYNEDFAREYIAAWRNEIVWACEKQKNKL